jgi:hypothetical protein
MELWDTIKKWMSGGSGDPEPPSPTTATPAQPPAPEPSAAEPAAPPADTSETGTEPPPENPPNGWTRDDDLRADS